MSVFLTIVCLLSLGGVWHWHNNFMPTSTDNDHCLLQLCIVNSTAWASTHAHTHTAADCYINLFP